MTFCGKTSADEVGDLRKKKRRAQPLFRFARLGQRRAGVLRKQFARFAISLTVLRPLQTLPMG